MNNDSKKEISGIALLIGVIGGTLMFSMLSINYIHKNPSDFALGIATTSHKETLGGRPISGQGIDIHKVIQTLKGFDIEHKKTILWLGASQLHAINKYTNNDHLAVWYSNQQAIQDGLAIRYLQVSSPNATYYDLLSFYLCFRQSNALPDTLIVAITYDDFGESILQLNSLSGILPHPNLDVLAWQHLVEIGGAGVKELQSLYERELAPEQPAEALNRSSTKDTPQESLEEILVDKLEHIWPAYSARNNFLANIKGEAVLMIGSVTGNFMRRNRSRIPKNLITWNNQALDSIIALCAADGVNLLLYRQPITPKERKTYYNFAGYNNFFKALHRKSTKLGFNYADLETIVPDSYWGRNNSGRQDVFHFQDYGHRELGLAVHAIVTDLNVTIID